MNETTSSKPMYEKIFDEVKQLIVNKSYGQGERVPSEKELAETYNVSRITSKKALEMLAAEHLIVRKPGRGSFVVDPAVDYIDSVLSPKTTSDRTVLIPLTMRKRQLV